MGERIDRMLGLIECIRMGYKCVEVYLGMRSGAIECMRAVANRLTRACMVERLGYGLSVDLRACVCMSLLELLSYVLSANARMRVCMSLMKRLRYLLIANARMLVCLS